jgi:hypothetical protein
LSDPPAKVGVRLLVAVSGFLRATWPFTPATHGVAKPIAWRLRRPNKGWSRRLSFVRLASLPLFVATQERESGGLRSVMRLESDKAQGEIAEEAQERAKTYQSRSAEEFRVAQPAWT